MQILFHPMYSKQELNADSNYVAYTSLIRAMRAVRPDWDWFVLFPDAKSDYKYDYDGFFDLPNVVRIPQRISPRKFANAISYDADWYDTLLRSYGFDVILNTLVEVSGHLRLAGDRGFDDSVRPVVIASHFYMIHDSLPYPFDSMANVAAAQVMGGVLADHNIFDSDHCRQMYIDTARKWLHESAIASALAKSTRIHMGTLEPELTYAPPETEPPLIGYNHRLQGYKNFEQTFALFDRLHREGVPFRVRYMNNAAEHTAAIAHYPFVEIKLCAKRADYLRALRECALNVTNSQHETFCIAAVEAMALGQPLVAPAGVTFPEITGQSETHYPYLFHNAEEQYQMVKKLLLDAAERRKWGRVLSDYVRAQFGAQVWATRHAELFERLTQDTTPIIQDDVRPYLEDLLKRMVGCTLPEFVTRARALVINGRHPYAAQSLSLTKAVRLTRVLGYDVRLHKGVQRIVMRPR